MRVFRTSTPASTGCSSTGSSKRSLILSMEDTHRLPSVSRVHMIECSGNGLTVPEPSTAPPPCRWTMPRTSASPRA